MAQINDSLGVPLGLNEEFARYQIASDAARAFLDWTKTTDWHDLSPDLRDRAHPHWREINDDKLNGLLESALARARDRA